MFTAEKIEKRKADVERSIAETWVEVKGTITRLDQLQDRSLHLSHLQGELKCIVEVLNCFKHKQDPSFILVHLATTLARGSDDAWSGRGNDFCRSQHDGYIKEAQRWINACEDDNEMYAEDKKVILALRRLVAYAKADKAGAE